MVQSVEKLPGSFKFSGSLFCIMALHSSVNAIVSRSSNLLFRVMISLRNLAYEGICKIASTKGILICNCLKIFTNFSKFLSSLSLESLRKWNSRRYRNGNGGCRLFFFRFSFTTFPYAYLLLHSLISLFLILIVLSIFYHWRILESFTTTKSNGLNVFPRIYLRFTRQLPLILIINRIGDLTNLDLHVSIHSGRLVQPPL